MEKAISDILEHISSDEPAADVSLCFGMPGYSEAPLSKDNFNHITPAVPVGSMSFIDGGNAELISTAGSCVHFIRVFHTIYKNNKRASCATDEFFVLAESNDFDGELVYSAKLFKSRASTLTDSFFDEEFIFKPTAISSTDAKISLVPGVIRRLAELSTALLLTTSAEENDTIVIDGDLSARLGDEQKLISALKSVSQERKVTVCGIAKTSHMLASDGTPISSLLGSIAPAGAWYYYPAARCSHADISFCRFHERSRYIFKLESFTNKDDLFKALSSNSTDAVFIGYPYGLIEADRFARVSNREKDMLRTTFMAKAGKSWEEISAAESSINAHSVLDNI